MIPFLRSEEWKTCEADLRHRYRANALPYHNLAHIESCLAILAALEVRDSREAIEIAIWFHDVIYDPRGKDNERKSAALARDQLEPTSLSRPEVDHVARLIEVTDHKRPLETEAEKLIVDIDLSILGSAPEIYEIYAHQIRAEYSFIDEETYRGARSQVLKSFLQRDSIYLSETLGKKWESQARKNLEAELLRLSR